MAIPGRPRSPDRLDDDEADDFRAIVARVRDLYGLRDTDVVKALDAVYDDFTYSKLRNALKRGGDPPRPLLAGLAHDILDAIARLGGGKLKAVDELGLGEYTTSDRVVALPHEIEVRHPEAASEKEKSELFAGLVKQQRKADEILVRYRMTAAWIKRYRALRAAIPVLIPEAMVDDFSESLADAVAGVNGVANNAKDRIKRRLRDTISVSGPAMARAWYENTAGLIQGSMAGPKHTKKRDLTAEEQRSRNLMIDEMRSILWASVVLAQPRVMEQPRSRKQPTRKRSVKKANTKGVRR